jgi:hypothetical protein
MMKQMIEFSEDLSERFDGVVGVSQRAYYRLSVRKGEIPYFNGGLDVQEFSYSMDLQGAVSRVLSDFDASVSVTGDRVCVGNIDIALPGGLT